MIEFILNGTKVISKAAHNSRLLDVLREEFGLLGPKEGCGEGECGACSVLINGNIQNSCITPMGSISDQNILTLEGYRNTQKYTLLEQTFAEAGAVQCGFCTPGMIMAAESLLNKNPNPTIEDIRMGISGNLCRCTGYNMIVEAITLAAKRGNGLW